MPKIIFYYQTFTELNISKDVTHVHLSSIHFGTEADGQPYIHLNNLYPENEKFDHMWEMLHIANAQGTKIIAMIGGAGGGFSSLASNYDVYFQQLVDFLSRHKIISGIDLDIEESFSLELTTRLIEDIIAIFPHYTICLAPIQSSLENDSPGLSGFIYKDLLHSSAGKHISYLNTQFYSNLSLQSFQTIVANGYDPNLIVVGSLQGTGDPKVIQQIAAEYPAFGGVFSWEYFNTLPTPQDWVNDMNSIINSGAAPPRGALGINSERRHNSRSVVHDDVLPFMLWCCTIA